MKLSIALTSFLAVSFAAVAQRSHIEKGNLDLVGGRKVDSGNDIPVASFELRGIAFTPTSTDDCTESPVPPFTSSTAQGIVTVPSSTEIYTKPSVVSSSTSSTGGLADTSTSIASYVTSLPSSTSTPLLPTSTTQSIGKSSSSAASYVESSSSTTRGNTMSSSSTESCSETSNLPSTSSTAQGIATSFASTTSYSAPSAALPSTSMTQSIATSLSSIGSSAESPTSSLTASNFQGASSTSTPLTQSPSHLASTTASTSASSTVPIQCNQDNCLREFMRSSSSATAFCATFTATSYTATTGLPAFPSQCMDSPLEISSACSCFMGPPETSTTTLFTSLTESIFTRPTETPSGAAQTSSITSLTTLTVYTTTLYTITSCASTFTNCPGTLGQVTTETFVNYTTICPVSEASSFFTLPSTTSEAQSTASVSNYRSSSCDLSSGSTAQGIFTSSFVTSYYQSSASSSPSSTIANLGIFTVLSSHSSSGALIALSNLPHSTQSEFISTTVDEVSTSTFLSSSTVFLLTTVTTPPSASPLAVLETESPAFAPSQPQAQVTTISVMSTSTSVSLVIDLTTILVTPDSSVAAAQSGVQNSSTGPAPATILSNQMSSSPAPASSASAIIQLTSSNLGASYQPSLTPASIVLTFTTTTTLSGGSSAIIETVVVSNPASIAALQNSSSVPLPGTISASVGSTSSSVSAFQAPPSSSSPIRAGNLTASIPISAGPTSTVLASTPNANSGPSASSLTTLQPYPVISVSNPTTFATPESVNTTTAALTSSSCTLWAYPSAPGLLAFQATSAPGAQCVGWTTITPSATQTQGKWNGTATETMSGQNATPQLPWMGSGQTMSSTTPLIAPLPSSTTSSGQSMGMDGGVRHTVALLVGFGALMLLI